MCQLCGDSAECIFDALLAGEEVGLATLEEIEANRAYQEAIGGENAGEGVVTLSHFPSIPRLSMETLNKRPRGSRTLSTLARNMLNLEGIAYVVRQITAIPGSRYELQFLWKVPRTSNDHLIQIHLPSYRS